MDAPVRWLAPTVAKIALRGPDISINPALLSAEARLGTTPTEDLALTTFPRTRGRAPIY